MLDIAKFSTGQHCLPDSKRLCTVQCTTTVHFLQDADPAFVLSWINDARLAVKLTDRDGR